MTTSDPRHYDIIISPIISEKANAASEGGGAGDKELAAPPKGKEGGKKAHEK